METAFIGKKLQLFLILELAMLCAMIEVEIIFKETIDSASYFNNKKGVVRGQLRRRIQFSPPCDLLLDSCYPAFAMGMFFYGYGIVKLKTFAPFEHILRRLKYVTVRVWRHMGFLQLLPWLCKVSMHLEYSAVKIYLYYNNPNFYEADHFLKLLACVILLWFFQLVCVIGVLLHAAILYDTLRTGRYLNTARNPDLRSYVESLNRLLGWEVVPTD